MYHADRTSAALLSILLLMLLLPLLRRRDGTAVENGFVRSSGSTRGRACVDIDPEFRNDSRSNKGEIFYSIVADPAGTLSCPHGARLPPPLTR